MGAEYVRDSIKITEMGILPEKSEWSASTSSDFF
jgi:hypothetical protein